MNDSSNKSNIIKVLLVGEQAVGKSSLMCRYVDDTFNLNMMGTAGLDLKKKIVTINNQKMVVYIYDNAGQERFRSICHSQFKNVHGVIIVYDVTDRNSYECVSSWVASLNKYGESKKEIILIGNKIDLKDDIAVTTQEGVMLARENHCPFIETSAKDSINVKEGFMKIIGNIYNKEFAPKNSQNSTQITSDSNIREEKNDYCCFIY